MSIFGNQLYFFPNHRLSVVPRNLPSAFEPLDPCRQRLLRRPLQTFVFKIMKSVTTKSTKALNSFAFKIFHVPNYKHLRIHESWFKSRQCFLAVVNEIMKPVHVTKGGSVVSSVYSL